MGGSFALFQSAALQFFLEAQDLFLRRLLQFFAGRQFLRNGFLAGTDLEDLGLDLLLLQLQRLCTLCLFFHTLSCLGDVQSCGILLNGLALHLGLQCFQIHTKFISLTLGVFDLLIVSRDILRELFHLFLQFIHLTTSSQKITVILKCTTADGTAGN